MLFCHAIPPRTGLGNRLFPWARCKLFSTLHDVPMLATRWWQWKVGPILRRESDWRLYFGLFQRVGGEIRGLRRRAIALSARETPEPEDLAAPPAGAQGRRIVTFRGWKTYFRTLNGHHDLLRKELDRALSPATRRLLEGHDDLPPIGIHVRRGDFTEAQSEKDFETKGLLRSPIAWFRASLDAVREAAGADVPAFIVSDGSPDELAPLLEAPRTKLVEGGSALSDLVLLGRARYLIASGGSSFSAWACFLGQMPTLSIPGQSLTWFEIEPAENQYVGVFDPAHPPREALMQARAALA